MPGKGAAAARRVDGGIAPKRAKEPANGGDLWKPGPPNLKDTLKGAFGPADKTFRLQRAGLAQCTDQMFDDERKALLGSAP